MLSLIIEQMEHELVQYKLVELLNESMSYELLVTNLFEEGVYLILVMQSEHYVDEDLTYILSHMTPISCFCKADDHAFCYFLATGQYFVDLEVPL